MQNHRRMARSSTRAENTRPNVTSAVGLGETAGRVRARRSSLFTRTVIWVTSLICLAFLLGSLTQAWSNSQLIQRMQAEQQRTQQLQHHNTQLKQLARHYNDPFVIESEARQQLGYIRPGEHPVVIISSSGQRQSHPSQVTHSPSQQNFWQEWWNVFFGS